jgi:hypothetical protein
MIGTTFKWWRASVYLAILVAGRAEITTYITPWVDSIKSQLGTDIQPETATYVCIALLMGLILAADKVLFGVLNALAPFLILLCVGLIISACYVLTNAQADGPCAPFNKWADLIACGPVVVQQFSDLANPILDTVRTEYFHWILWCISFLGGIPHMAQTAIQWFGIALFVCVGLYILSVLETRIRNLIRRLRFEAAVKAEPHLNRSGRDTHRPTLQVRTMRQARKI